MKSSVSILLLSTSTIWSAHAFAPKAFQTSSRPQQQQQKQSITLYETAAESDVDEPAMNPDNPALPELKGDFDWDEKFAGDEDWITENVPGKVVLNEIALAEQVTALNKLEEQWRKERLREEYDDSATVGFVGNAELLNGRFAMFFLATGLLTEYWTGVSIPGQVEELLRIGGFIGFD